MSLITVSRMTRGVKGALGVTGCKDRPALSPEWMSFFVPADFPAARVDPPTLNVPVFGKSFLESVCTFCSILE